MQGGQKVDLWRRERTQYRSGQRTGYSLTVKTHVLNLVGSTGNGSVISTVHDSIMSFGVPSSLDGGIFQTPVTKTWDVYLTQFRCKFFHSMRLHPLLTTAWLPPREEVQCTKLDTLQQNILRTGNPYLSKVILAVLRQRRGLKDSKKPTSSGKLYALQPYSRTERAAAQRNTGLAPRVLLSSVSSEP